MKTTIPQKERSTIIQTTQLTKTFGSLTAVNDLHLNVSRGDVFGFLGHNGSGKTTTIRMLLGLIRPTHGSIQIFGMDTATHLAFILPRLGAIIETPVFYPYLSGRDNLRVLAIRSGMQIGRRGNERIEYVLDLVDLRDRATARYHTYSLGMKQRLGIAAALLTDPELILLDEPTNGLDPKGVQEIRTLIRQLSELGKTIFISSHLLHEIQLMCNRVAILHKGHLIQQGNVQDLLCQERVIVRMLTEKEAEQAFTTLQQEQRERATWIQQIRWGTDNQKRKIILIDVPLMHSSDVIALLVQRQLFATEVYHYQPDLEEFFLQVTAA